MVGFPRDYYKDDKREFYEPTLWNHIEGAMMYLSEKTMLVIRDVNIKNDNGISSIGDKIILRKSINRRFHQQIRRI
ncbi:MAG: hypothetical protein R6U96_19345 [Promethearchaeia archaeon]